MSKRDMLSCLLLLCASTWGCHRTQKNGMGTAEQETRAIDLLRRAYDSFNRGNIAGALKDLDPEIEWTEPDSFTGAGTYYGRKGVAQYLTQSRTGWAEGRSEPERFITAGNRVVVLVHARIRMQGSSDWHDVRLADVYTFRDGRPIQMRAFADRQEALRWAGATETLWRSHRP